METNAIRASLYTWTMSCFWICKFCYHIKNIYVYHRTRSNLIPQTLYNYFALTNASCRSLFIISRITFMSHIMIQIYFSLTFTILPELLYMQLGFHISFELHKLLFLWREKDGERKRDRGRREKLIKFLKLLAVISMNSWRVTQWVKYQR